MSFRISSERRLATPVWSGPAVQRVDGQIRSPVATPSKTYLPHEGTSDFYNGGLPGSERSALSRAFVAASGVFEVAWDVAHRLSGHRTIGRVLEQPVENPRPVILLGGMGSSERSWNLWKRSLERDGFPVFVFHDSAHALGDVVDATRSFEDFVEQVKRQTGARMVDAVGFSSGGHAIRTYVQLEKQGREIGSAVLVAVPNQGCTDQPFLTGLGRVPLVGPALLRQIPVGEYEEIYGSPLIEALAATDGERDGALMTSIYSGAFDGIVAPPDSPYLPEATNVVLEDDRKLLGLPLHDNHLAILQLSPAAYESMRSALLQGLKDRPSPA